MLRGETQATRRLSVSLSQQEGAVRKALWAWYEYALSLGTRASAPVACSAARSMLPNPSLQHAAFAARVAVLGVLLEQG
jgi:hypothetical protein